MFILEAAWGKWNWSSEEPLRLEVWGAFFSKSKVRSKQESAGGPMASCCDGNRGFEMMVREQGHPKAVWALDGPRATLSLKRQ